MTEEEETADEEEGVGGEKTTEGERQSGDGEVSYSWCLVEPVSPLSDKYTLYLYPPPPNKLIFGGV